MAKSSVSSNNEIAPGVYSVGAVDWNVRNFHGYTTKNGATYNAYLIMDEKICLIDTVKAPFTQDLIDNISRITDVSKIDYIISNHVEMDHSGAIAAIAKLAPNAQIITSSTAGVSGLTAHYGPLNYVAVKAGDVINLGKNELHFAQTPMLHWPDNIVTYCPQLKILFSNDAFGQHYASSYMFDDEAENFGMVMQEAKKYYANILMPFGAQAQKAVDIVSGLDVKLVAPSHGLIWRSHFAEVLENYKLWSSNCCFEKAMVVYDSMWGSTTDMAVSVMRGFEAAGVEAKLFDLKENHISDIMTDLLDAKYIAVGSPTLNNNMLPTVAAFLCYLKGLAPKGRLGFAFGSYGWSGQSIPQVEEQLEAAGVHKFADMYKIKFLPTEQNLSEIKQVIADAIKA